LARGWSLVPRAVACRVLRGPRRGNAPELPDCTPGVDRISRIADVAPAHTHALLGIFDRSAMAAMIAARLCHFVIRAIRTVADSARVTVAPFREAVSRISSRYARPGWLLCLWLGRAPGWRGLGGPSLWVPP